MSSFASIGDIITSVSHDLQLDWQPERIPLPENITAFDNWAGVLQPDSKHVIELVDARHTDSHNTWLLEDSPATAFIFCEAVRLSAAMQNIVSASHVVATPLPASAVLPVLLTAFAEQLSEHTHQHGVFMQIFNQGVFITGDSGVGKSSLALELIERQHCLVADDSPLFYRFASSEQIHGLCPALLQGFLHVRDLGALNIGKLFGQQALACASSLDLIIELDNADNRTLETTFSVYSRSKILLGIEIPVIKLSVKGNRNLPLIVETAVKNYILYKEGYDANKALATKLQQELENSTT